MKIYNNIPLLIEKKEIEKIKQQLNEQIPMAIKEFNMYYKTNKEIRI